VRLPGVAVAVCGDLCARQVPRAAEPRGVCGTGACGRGSRRGGAAARGIRIGGFLRAPCVAPSCRGARAARPGALRGGRGRAAGKKGRGRRAGRVRGAFDRFIEVGDCSDEEAAGLLRGIGIDVAVDLMGYTQGLRLGILAHRVAPVQATYLGYAGTLGAPYMDYLIADAVAIPAS